MAGRIAELTRDSYGRLLALLAAPSRDITAAEDCLADAIERALTRWPHDGVPANPEAWILTVARNRLRDMWKSSAYRMTEPLDEIDSGPTETDDVPAIPDRRLELMLVCAHPAIAHNIRTPLMLQVVLGVEAADIAEAFAVPAGTMAQRLVRAKKRIRDAGIPFVIPDREDLAERLPAVLEAVYGAYAIDWQVATDGPAFETLSAEALHLTLLLTELLPDEPEVLGLAALVCLSEARRPARRGMDGGFVPLDEQDTTRWDRALIHRGEAWLHRAHAFGRPDRYQYEAAIQSAHCDRARSGASTGMRCASCTVRWFRSLRRWVHWWHWPRWTAKSTVQQRDCARSTRSPILPSSASSRPGPPARICWPMLAAGTTRHRPTNVRSNSPPTPVCADT